MREANGATYRSASCSFVRQAKLSNHSNGMQNENHGMHAVHDGESLLLDSREKGQK